ncbi:MAG TPA: type 4a pilus biogenesis protein PilO [Micromonosporaceae bacterium]|nr:type 4a pilus biogenesis protein PilO [Micromonosporaceae bacterium]
MATRHAARIWALAGVLAGAALILIGWFLLIGPQRAETGSLHERVTASEDQAIVLQRRLTELREQAEQLPRYRAELAANRKALPAVPDTPDFVRDVQAAGEQTGVAVTGVNVGEPTSGSEDDPAAGTGVFTLPITLTCQGSASQIQSFLDQLQRERPRAVLIKAVALSPAGEDGDALSANLRLDAFVAP